MGDILEFRALSVTDPIDGSMANFTDGAGLVWGGCRRTAEDRYAAAWA
jgi:hypothetical protein